jgi:hypothetical protein
MKGAAAVRAAAWVATVADAVEEATAVEWVEVAGVAVASNKPSNPNRSTAG